MSLVALAQSLGLSTSTVSRALNGYADVSANTRQRVEDAARRIGYRPHPVAHRLATGRTGAIALVSTLPSGNHLDASFSALLSGAADYLRDRQYFALSVILPAGAQEMPEFERFLGGRLVDGIVLARTRIDDPRVRLLQQRGIPFVTHGRTRANAPHAWVDADNEGAFEMATQRLIGLGHRRIAFINGQPEMTFAALRAQAFERALLAGGLDRAGCPVLHGEVNGAWGEQAARELLAANQAKVHPQGPITAFLCATDAVALGAMSAIKAAGLTVGRDISVIGYGNTDAGRYATPALTTIDNAVVDNGKHLAEFLLRQIADEPATPPTRLDPVHLIARQSDGPVPTAA